jgi:predicted transcriptional regulator
MAELQMGAVESQFADMIWELEPVHSRELVKLAEEKLDWKKSTTFRSLLFPVLRPSQKS